MKKLLLIIITAINIILPQKAHAIVSFENIENLIYYRNYNIAYIAIIALNILATIILIITITKIMIALTWHHTSNLSLAGRNKWQKAATFAIFGIIFCIVVFFINKKFGFK